MKTKTTVPRLLSILLCCVMLMGLLPTVAFAAYPADIDDNVWVQVPYLTSKDKFSGSGTESDPFYAESFYNRGSLDKITITTANPQAKINGQEGSWIAELQYGYNDIRFTVVSADETATAYYHVKWERTKPTRENPTIPRDSLSGVPATNGNSDGKIVGLDASEHYDYKAANSSEWTHISGTTEIIGLSAGQYKVKYGESENYKAASDSNATNVRVGNASEEITIKNSTNYTFVDLPSKATEGERIDLKMEITGENQWVKQITAKWAYTPTGGWGSSAAITVRFVGYTIENGKKYYNGYFIMPSYKNPMIVEIKDVTMSEENYYSIQKAQEIYIETKITPKNTTDTNFVNGETVYRGSSEVTIEVSVNQGFGTRLLKSFKVSDSTGNIVATSDDGAKVTVSVTDDLRICDVVTETIFADFTEMEAQLNRLKGVNLYNYTDNTRVVVEERLKLVEPMYTLTQKDQKMVDDFVLTLKSAIDGLVPKKGDFTEINNLMSRIPEDLSVYTESSVAALTTVIAEAETTIEEDWNRLRQDEINAIADRLEEAIENLEYKDADYSKVDEAIAKANALNKDNYKDFAGVEAAVKAVVRGKNITEQSEVDKMAKAIEDAIATLEKKPASTKPGTSDKSPQTGDTSNLALWIALLFASGGAVTVTTVYGRKKKYNR